MLAAAGDDSQAARQALSSLCQTYWFLVTWSPALAWIGCVGVPMFGEPRVSADVAFILGSLAFLLMAAGVAWTIANPGRGPHDRIVGTWVLPR